MMNVLDNGRSEMVGGSSKMVGQYGRNDEAITEAFIAVAQVLLRPRLRGMVNRTRVRQTSEGWIVSRETILQRSRVGMIWRERRLGCKVLIGFFSC